MLWKVVLNATTNKKLFKIYSDKGLCDNKLSGTVFFISLGTNEMAS